MYEAYVTYVDDEYVEHHDYDDGTDDDTDNDTGDDTYDVINTHIIVRSGYPAGHLAYKMRFNQYPLLISTLLIGVLDFI